MIPEKKALIDIANDQLFHTCIDAYINSKIDFNRKISSKEWTNFENYLSFYNCRDVDILVKGINGYISLFSNEFNTSPLQSMSMPSFASRLSFRLYDKSLSSVFTFSDAFGWVNAEIREHGLNGGITGN